MDFESRLEALKQHEADDTLIQELVSVQEEAFAANDADSYLKCTHWLFDLYVQLGETDQATSLFLELVESPPFESYKTNFAIIDKLINLLLKTEDFQALKTVLFIRERYLPSHPEQRLMQSFYLAVCYEGLKDYPQAIQTLEAITDTISNSNLVSKYLKLAMLFIKTDQLHSAKAAYDHAAIFDKKKKNDMFYLVASDIAYAEERYQDALKEFEAFFLKTKVKTRYLDRYLWICIQLEKWTEAWDFYKTYLPKMNQTMSKNYRLLFYEASLALAKKTNQMNEQWILSEAIAVLNDSNMEINDAFDGIQSLLSMINDPAMYQSQRAVILYTFRSLGGLIDVNRLIYVAPSLDGLTVYTYKKGLLMEKTYSQSQWSKTLLNTIISADLKFHLMNQEDLCKENDYLSSSPFEPNTISHVLSYRIESFHAFEGMMMLFLSEERTYDYVNRLAMTTQKLLNHHLTIYKQLTQFSQTSTITKRLLEKKQFGLLKIKDNVVFFENDRAKTMLETRHDFIDYEQFQLMMGAHPVYIDEFLRSSTIRLNLSIRNTNRVIDCSIWLMEQDIYLLCEDITERIDREAIERHVRNNHPYRPIHTLSHMQQCLNDSHVAQTLMTFWFLNESDNGMVSREMRLDWLIKTVEKQAKSSLQSMVIEDACLIVLIKTTDKRIIERIWNETESAWNLAKMASPFFSPTMTLRGSSFATTPSDTLNQALVQMNKTLFIDENKPGHYPYNRVFVSRWNQIETLQNQLRDDLKQKSLPLMASQVVNVLTKKTECYLIEVDQTSWLADKTYVPAMLNYYHLEREMGFLMMDQLVQSLIRMQKNEQKTISAMVDVPACVLAEDKRLDDWLIKFKRNKFKLSQLYFRITDKSVFDWGIETVKTLKEKGVHWVLALPKYDALKVLEEHADLIDYVYFDASDSLFKQPAMLSLFTPSRRIYLMVGGIQDNETMTLFKSYHVSLMMGNLFIHDVSLDTL